MILREFNKAPRWRRKRLVEQIAAAGHPADVVAEASRLVWRGTYGSSDGPAQQAVNEGVASLIHDELPAAREGGLAAVIAAIEAMEWYAMARTQRTAHIPDSYLAAREALREVLAAAAPALAEYRRALPELAALARREYLRAQPASVVAIPFSLRREAGSARWYLYHEGTGETSSWYYCPGILSSRSIVMSVTFIEPDRARIVIRGRRRECEDLVAVEWSAAAGFSDPTWYSGRGPSELFARRPGQVCEAAEQAETVETPAGIPTEPPAPPAY